jgi:modulator of FtsH protease HflK
MSDKTQPGLHFVVPVIEKVNIVNVAEVRRAEIGFRSTKSGPKRVDHEALMLTGDENIVEAQMIVQYKVADPVRYLFQLRDPEKSLHIAAEVALRGVVGQTRITADKADLEQADRDVYQTPSPAPAPAASASAAPSAAPPPAANAPGRSKNTVADDTDILTTGRQDAQDATKKKLQELMDLYQSGLLVVDVKLQAVDAPDEVKDAFHDVVRAREEREKKMNKAYGYSKDKIPRARGKAKKIVRAAEAYRSERIEMAKGEAARFTAILREYRKARSVTRQRLHLETMERILQRVKGKVFIDEDVAKQALPLLPLGGSGGLLGNSLKKGGK